MLNEKDWISVAKNGLPKKNGRYLCTVNNIGFDFVEVVSFANNLSKVDEFDFFGYNRAGWYDYDSEVGHYEVTDVVAYMELPKPYKEKED